MKTKFFKKLSFVLVVAMVLSLLVPAAGVFAATKPELNSTNKYLYLGRDDANEFNFNINNKQKGWQYYWESADEDVVVVDEGNGVVTAVGVGKTEVTVEITDADDEEIATLVAAVTVRDIIVDVTIKNPVEGTLGVNAEHDFDRSYVTESGSKKKTDSITRWEVDSEDASIDPKGVFVATKAGEYKVTARSFQSKARFNAWTDDAVKYADYVLATDETTVVVAGSMLEAKQTGLSSVDVYFDSPVADADKNLSVHQIVGTTPVKQLVKEIKMSDDKKVATITMYLPFTTDVNYQVDYTGMDSVNFKAATTKSEDVASMQITTSTAVLNVAETIKFKLFNAAGVDITTTELSNRVTLKSSDGIGTWFNPTTKQVTIFNKDAFTTITATYHTYKYDTLGKEIGAFEVSGVVMGIEEAVVNVGGLKAWTLVNDNKPVFDDVKQVLAVGDTGYKLYVKFITTKTGSDDGAVDNSAADAGKFSFKSSDSSTLIVDSTGGLYPVKEGSVVVVVSYGENTKSPIGAITVNITSKRAASIFNLDKENITLSNAPGANDEETVKVSIKDQLDKDIAVDYKIERLSGSPDKVDDFGNTPDPIDTTQKTGDIVVKGTNKVKGTYYYRVTVKEMVRVITVTILDGKDDMVATSYRLEISGSTVDLKAEDDKTDKDVTIELVGYNKSNIKVSKATVNGVNFGIEITAPETAWNQVATVAFAGKYNVSKGTTGTAVAKAPTGTYTVTAKQLKGTDLVTIDVKYFTLTDSQTAPVLAEVKSLMFDDSISDITNKKDAGLIQAVKDALKFTLDGNDVTANIQEVEAFGNTSEFNVINVVIRQTFKNGSFIDHKVNVGLNLSK